MQERDERRASGEHDYPHYHEPEDTADKLDYDRLARVVTGLEKVVRTLVASGV